jgi:hypothetical protein
LGASYSTADLFRNAVIVGRAFSPSHLTHCIGISLKPVLLLAG